MNFLSLSEVFNTVWAVLLAILILLAMITVHEFGHYLSGKILKFKIDEFSIGFGPALFKRKNKKNGELFSIRLLPLGGYCAFTGEDERDVNEQKEEAAFEPKIDSAEGQVRCEASSCVQSADEQALTPMQQERSLTAPVKENLPTPARAAEESERVEYFNDKAPWKRIIVLISGALMNYLLALLLIVILFVGFGQPVYKIGAIEESSAYSAEYSLSADDLILKVDGKTVYLITDIMQALNGKSEGEYVDFTVLRDGDKQTVKVILRDNCDFNSTSETSKIWRALGLDTVEREDGTYWAIGADSYRNGFFNAVGASFGYSFRIAGTIFRALGELLTGKLALTSMGGPITTIKLTSELAVQSVQSFLEIAAYIGINLAVFNLLPIPALDGSKVVFCFIEWIFKKPVPRKIEAVIHVVGLIAILAFAVLVDVLQFVL